MNSGKRTLLQSISFAIGIALTFSAVAETPTDKNASEKVNLFLPTDPNFAALCTALTSPHKSIAGLIAHVSDETALLVLKENYPELMTWLKQKSDSTIEGKGSVAKGIYGPSRNLTPSAFLFNEDITEVNRTAVGFLALKWILANDYEAFTRGQNPFVKLKPDSFQFLRQQVLDVLDTPEAIDAMIVLILTNDLGKVKRYHEITEKASERAIVDHDALLFMGFSEWPELSPSFLRLPDKFKASIILGLKMGSKLNGAQLAQAENLPANLLGVQALQGSMEAFLFKWVELLLDVSGASGHIDSGGAIAMIEPVFQGYQTAKIAVQQVINGRSVFEAYDYILVMRNELLKKGGFRGLDVQIPKERALLRLITLRRSNTKEQANEVIEVFESLPKNVREILISELNKDGVKNWGVLPYYTPGLIVNALKLSATPFGSTTALKFAFTALANLMQEARHVLKKREGSGVLTLNIEPLAGFILAPESGFLTDPLSILNKKYELFQQTENEFGVRLTSNPSIHSDHFRRLESLASIPGQKVAVIGIGGGSDGVQAAQLSLMLKNAGKDVPFVGSIRTKKITHSLHFAENTGKSRQVIQHSGKVADGVYRVSSATTFANDPKNKLRFLENLPSDQVPMFVILENEDVPLAVVVEKALQSNGGVDTIILVDTGGDSLYPELTDEDLSRSSPDQDRRVIQSLNSLTIKNKLLAVIAAGLDSPANAEEVLMHADAKFYPLSEADSYQVLNNYRLWQMDGNEGPNFGLTSLAWQAAIRGEFGLQVLPLPTRVVIDPKNPWSPFVRIQPSMAGIFFLDLSHH